MKIFLVSFCIIFNLISCFEKKGDTHKGTTVEKHINFGRVNDSIQVSFYLDTRYNEMPPGIYMWGPDKCTAFSNTKDTLYIMIYDLTGLDLNNFNCNLLQKDIFDNAKSTGSIITNYNCYFDGRMAQINYYEASERKLLFAYQIIDTENNISTKLFLNTIKDDSSAITYFHELKKSFNLKIISKNGK